MDSAWSHTRHPDDPDELVSACETIWELYRVVGDDDMTDGTYDRNDFNVWLIMMCRFVAHVEHVSDAALETFMAAFRRLSDAEPNEDRRDQYFERVMDSEYDRSSVDQDM